MKIVNFFIALVGPLRGDVFKFVEDYRNISFLESVQVLAERSGINVTLLQDKSQEVKKEHPHQKLF